MHHLPDHIRWIDTQAQRAQRLLIRWANINSGSTHLAGLARMADELEKHFGKLAIVRRHNLPVHRVVDAVGNVTRQPLGQALSLIKRPRARRRALLVIHMDTVYPATARFQKCDAVRGQRLRGPGVVDAKGGLLVMLLALEALERSAIGNKLGWQVIVNPDEELGSPGSSSLLTRAARRCDAGLVFESCMPDGALVSHRKGSGNFALVVRGRAAHAGRDFDKGRNAVAAAARAAQALDKMTHARHGITVNVARIDGGSPLNQVPDVAVVQFNVRYTDPKHEGDLRTKFDTLIDDINAREGYRATLHGGFGAPPKPTNDAIEAMLAHVRACGRALGMAITTRPTGGVCDGNRLVAAGLPTLDTLGPQGGHLHSEQEYVVLPSIVQRAKLTALLLHRLADDNEGRASRSQ
ncbi:MAG: hydrolase [Phycisphaeraceae bacterium]